MNKEQAYTIIRNFDKIDNIDENDEYAFIEASNFLIETEKMIHI